MKNISILEGKVVFALNDSVYEEYIYVRKIGLHFLKYIIYSIQLFLNVRVSVYQLM